MNLFPGQVALFAALVVAGNFATVNANTIEGYTRIDFTLPPDTEKLIIVDANQDGLSDVLTQNGNTINLFYQQDGLFDFNAPQTSVTLPGQATGWDISDDFALIALIDGQQVQRWQLQQDQFGEAETLLDNVSGFLPQGVHQLSLSRDLNDDGRPDLIIPGAGELSIFIRSTDGSYQQPLRVVSDMQLRSVLHPGRELGREVGQALRIPLMTLRDVNGDGLPDLISDTEERLDVFLARSNEAVWFNSEPDISVDRLAIRERLGDFDFDQLDFANLTGVLALTHEEILSDMNGDGFDDLILREGGRVALHLGTDQGVDLQQADQILRSGGNVLSVFLYDENEDDQPDLWLWRVEQVSLSDVFLWLAISGTINLEAYIYPNEGDSFARRPSRRINVALRFPSVLRLIGSVNEVRERASSMEAVIPAARVNGTQQAMSDLLVLMSDQLQLFNQALQPEADPSDDRFLASLNYSRSVDSYEIDIRRIIDQFDIEINRDVRAVSDRAPDTIVPLDESAARGDLALRDLNDDGRDDIFVLLQRNEESVTGILFLSH
ncbi:FG-GAP repeat domain-containing protein [Pseudohongiella spirulinae]|uniref:VCBS repeat-containing protein n=1 Tax=Pseudohongiella spirulinae TaxID=1249552 RepID=A0A0S2KB80_9GAMM|nr:VCBS repeat-containing protein [Pseudohongiella spirulinae]ALO45574.1 hypothetical protein PS2015_904 [Pseudohongiella spirulinae]